MTWFFRNLNLTRQGPLRCLRPRGSWTPRSSLLGSHLMGFSKPEGPRYPKNIHEWTYLEGNGNSVSLLWAFAGVKTRSFFRCPKYWEPYHAVSCKKSKKKENNIDQETSMCKGGSGPAIGSRGTQIIVRSLCPATDIGPLLLYWGPL